MKIRWLLTAALFLVFSFRTDAASINEAVTKSTETFVLASIRQHYKNENKTLSIQIEKNKLALPKNCIIDIETGSGHGGLLNFYRLNLEDDEVRIEKVTLQTGSMLIPEPKERCQVKRAAIKRKDINVFLEAVTILPAITLVEKSRISETKNEDGTYTFTESVWGSTSDFFILIRVLNNNHEVLLEKEYAGYFGMLDQLKYLPISAVGDIAESRLDKIDSWTDIPSDKWRESHLSDAFKLNRDLLLKDFHWWVLEDSLEGLAQAGNLSVRETIKFIQTKYKDRTKRIIDKINTIVTNFDYWLLGDPKILATSK